MATSISAESLKKAISFFSGAEMPARVWSRKYRLKDKADNFLEDDPLQTFCRMADAIGAPADSTLRRNLVDRRFIPAGRILFALGNSYFSAALKNCLTGNTLVLTDNGWAKMSSLGDRDYRQARLDGESHKITNSWSNGIRPIMRVETKEGFVVRGTADHRVRLEDGEWKTIDSLQNGDLLDLAFDSRSYGEAAEDDFEFGYAAGLFVGDGTFQGQEVKVANIRLFERKAHVPIDIVAGMFGGEVQRKDECTFYSSSAFAHALKERLGIERGNKTITEEVMSQSSAFHAGFLRGLFDADARVTLRYRTKGTIMTRDIRLGQSDKEFLRKIQTLLLGFGVKSRLYANGEAGLHKSPRGEFEHRAGWVIAISRASFQRFVERIGFSHPAKAAKAAEAVAYGRFRPEVWAARVESVEPDGEEEVFDISVEESHAFNAGGIVAHNCFVLVPQEDSLEAINDLRKEMARTYSRGGGVGIDLSRLRPAGAPVNNAAITSSGSVSFADGFSHLTGEIGQCGRRGALMVSLSVDHPDVRRFIHLKNDVPTDLADDLREKLPRKVFKRLAEEIIEPRRVCANANMSLRLTDRFMQSVKDGRPHVTRFVLDNGDLIEEVFDARQLFHEIAQEAWSHGCPGVLFWDTMERWDNRSYLDSRWHLVGTNPCQPGWATVLTPNGIRTMDAISVGSTIWSGKQWTKVTKKVQTGTKLVYAYRTRGGVFYGTENHRVVQGGEKVEAQYAESIDPCLGPDPLEALHGLGIAPRPERVMDGLVFGDGMVHKAPNNMVVLLIGEDDDDYLTDKEIKDLIIGPKPSIQKTAWIVKTRIRPEDLPKTYERTIPEWIRYGDVADQVAFLRGLYSANGSVIDRRGSYRVTLKASSNKVIEGVQEMLSALGIRSYYTVNKAHDVEFENEVYTCRESYDLNITTDRARFRSLIGFVQKHKQDRLEKICCVPTRSGKTKKSYEIVDIENLGEEPVYDITVEADEHTYWTGGLLVSNCAEQALSDGGSCLHGDTIISTTDGLRKIKDFDCGRIATASGRLAAAHDAQPDYGVPVVQDAVAFKTSDSRRILRVVVDAGMTVRVTPDHIFMTDVGEVRADQLIERGACVKWMNSNPISTPVRFSEDTEIPTMLGWMHGDGWMTESSVGISFNEEDGDFEIKDQLLATYFRLFGERKPLRDDGVSYQVQTESKKAYGVAEDYGVYLAKATNRRLPEKFYHFSSNQQLAFLAGLFTADGWVEGKSNRVIGYSTSSPRLVEDLKAVLGALGIQTRHYTTTFDGGRNDQHKLNITKASARKFMSLIGFLTEAKTRAFNWGGPEYSDKAWLPVTRVEEEVEEVSVYDFTVETTHMGFANGVLVHNCNLGAINLGKFTRQPYTEQAEFDWDGYKQAIRDGVSFLDAVNDIEVKEGRAPLPKQEECTIALRQVGLGVMGYADLLLQNQIPYGSDEAMEFTKKIFQTLRDTAYHQSVMLAKEHGPFPAYSWEAISKSPFIQSLPVELQRLIEKHGLRNSNLLSIAPTGSIAIIGETTGGIEPEFAFQYSRAVMMGDGKRTTFTVLSPTAQRIAKALGRSVPQGEITEPIDMSWLPDWAVAAHQIDPKRRVQIQGLIQKYIDVSISSTVNVPEESTVEDVMNIYQEAYSAGCKGITIYRSGSREGVLQTLSEVDRLEYPIEPPLQINSKRISFKGEGGFQRILISIGDYRPGVPCEAIITHGKSGTEVASYASALGIVISIALQHGVTPDKIAQAMSGINAGWAARLPLDGPKQKPTLIHSVPDAIAAVLKKFYGNGIYEKGLLGQPINGNTNKIGWELSDNDRKTARICPKCQKQSYVPDSGCWKCINPACDHDGLCG